MKSHNGTTAFGFRLSFYCYLYTILGSGAGDFQRNDGARFLFQNWDGQFDGLIVTIGWIYVFYLQYLLYLQYIYDVCIWKTTRKWFVIFTQRVALIYDRAVARNSTLRHLFILVSFFIRVIINYASMRHRVHLQINKRWRSHWRRN